jgi:hypothetical protein
MSEAPYPFEPYGEDAGSLWGSIKHTVSGAAHGISKGVKAVKKVPVLGLPLKAADKVLHSGAAAVLQKVLENPVISTAFGPVTISYEMALAGAKDGPAGLTRIAKLELKNPVRQAAMKAAAVVFPPLAPAAASYAAAAKVVDLTKSKNPAEALKAAAQIAATQALADNGDPGAIKGLEFINKAKSAMSNSPLSSAKALITAAHGITPGAIQKATGAAQAISNGSPVLKRALSQAVSHFRNGSDEHRGFQTAINVLKQTSGNKAALGAARRGLHNDLARHGFDVAMGTVAQAVSANPGALAKRAGSTFVPKMSKPRGKISAYQPNLKNAIDSLKRNPTLATQHPLVLANKFGTTQQTILQALNHVGSQRLLPWRSLSPQAARFIRKWHPNAPMMALTHGTGDTAGLDESGTKYIVTKGDSPFSIAKALTGNGNRWVELKSLNTDKKPDITKNVWVGEVLNIPASWQKPTAKQAPSPGPAVSSQPAPQAPSAPVAVPVVPASVSVAPGILQGKSILVAWSKTDGVNQAGVPDYGSTAADLSTDFGARDSMELMSFQNWDNKVGNAGLAVDGKLGPKSLAALQQWAESRAQQAIPSPVDVVSIPGQVTTLPEVLITAAPPSSPGIPQLPSASAPVPVSTPPVASTPATPPVAHPAEPATPATVAAAQPANGGKMGPALAGAAVGGVLFGLPGAIIGGIAGAAMA